LFVRQHVADDARTAAWSRDGAVHHPQHAAANHTEGELGMTSNASDDSTAPAGNKAPPAQPVPVLSLMWPMMGWMSRPDTARRSEDRDVFHLGAQGFKDAAHVGVLQGKAELNAHVAKSCSRAAKNLMRFISHFRVFKG